MDFALQRIHDFAKQHMDPPVDVPAFMRAIESLMTREVVQKGDQILIGFATFRFIAEEAAGTMCGYLEQFFQNNPSAPTVTCEG